MADSAPVTTYVGAAKPSKGGGKRKPKPTRRTIAHGTKRR